MKKEELLILERKDLIHGAIDKKMVDIEYMDFRSLVCSNILTSNFVVFINRFVKPIYKAAIALIWSLNFRIKVKTGKEKRTPKAENDEVVPQRIK